MRAFAIVLTFLAITLMRPGAAGDIENDFGLLDALESPSLGDMRKADVISAYLNGVVKGVSWPEGVELASAGAVQERGGNCAYCVVNAGGLSPKVCDELVIKAAALFGCALAEKGRLQRLCLTILRGGERARIFIPLDIALKIGTELDTAVTISLALKMELLTRCNLEGVERLLRLERKTPPSEPAALEASYAPESTPATVPAPGAKPRPVLVRYYLQDGSVVLAAESVEAGGAIGLTDDSGVFMRVKKSDLLRVVRP
jgi:hypothetical protein